MTNRVLVTGASGFIGANLVRRLIREGFIVHVTARKNSNLWRLTDTLAHIKIHNLNLENQQETQRLLSRIRPKIVFHLASIGLKKGVKSVR